VETSNIREPGQGDQFVYVYGLPCAPDRLKGRQVAGAGAEWLIATPEEVIAAYERVMG
jgi:hypothetical protein